MALMDALPPEILAQIVSLACCDGGRTACSLSLVSKYVSAVTEPYKFCVVALSGVTQISNFWESLIARSSSSNVPPKVTHLFLSNADKDHPDDVDGMPASTPPLGSCTYPAILRLVIDLISPTLETLTCILYGPNSDNIPESLLKTTFPRLTHLTLSVLFYWSRHLQPTPPRPPASSFPSLTHLHFAFGRLTDLSLYSAQTSAFCECTGTDTITHLRFSASRGLFLNIVSRLIRMGQDPMAVQPLPPSVKFFVLEPCVRPNSMPSRRESGMGWLQTLSVESRMKGDVVLEVLPTVSPGDWTKLGEWKDRWLAVQAGYADVNDEWSAGRDES